MTREEEMVSSCETNSLKQMKNPFRCVEMAPLDQSHGKQDV